MKRLFILLFTAALSLTAFAQTSLQPTVRSGNTYTVGDLKMNRYEYNAYLNQNCPQAYADFNKGMKLSNAGWGLFAGGLALDVASITMAFCHPVKDEKLPYHYAMDAMFITGNTMLAGSLPLLIVGYVKQHNAANTYNSLTQQYVTLNLSNNGLGLAYHF